MAVVGMKVRVGDDVGAALAVGAKVPTLGHINSPER